MNGSMKIVLQLTCHKSTDGQRSTRAEAILCKTNGIEQIMRFVPPSVAVEAKLKLAVGGYGLKHEERIWN